MWRQKGMDTDHHQKLKYKMVTSSYLARRKLQNVIMISFDFLPVTDLTALPPITGHESNFYL